jgi:hypothetical protein
VKSRYDSVAAFLFCTYLVMMKIIPRTNLVEPPSGLTILISPLTTGCTGGYSALTLQGFCQRMRLLSTIDYGPLTIDHQPANLFIFEPCHLK